jgi:hypothetical protein
LAGGQHSSLFIGELLGLKSFTGSVRIASTVPIIMLALNFEASPVFSSLPPSELVAISTLGTPVNTAYYFSHLAFGGGWQMTLTYVNASTQPVTCQTSFISEAGAPLAVPFGGTAVSARTDALAPSGSVHQQTQASLSSAVVTGWAQAQCNGPVKASLLFRFYSQGIAISEAGVNAMQAPAGAFATFAEAATGAAFVNSSSQSATITFTALNAAGQFLASKNVVLAPQQHSSAFLGALLGLSTFTGSVQIASTVPILSLTLNFEAAPAFSSLPPGELESGAALATGR